ncbi:DUF397 domain-containing protein [Streptomyces sp. NPDC058629]
MRDSKRPEGPEGPTVIFGSSAWSAFVSDVR